MFGAFIPLSNDDKEVGEKMFGRKCFGDFSTKINRNPILKGHFLHSRIPPVENGHQPLDFSGSSFCQSSRFYSFCALPRGGWCEGVLLYGSRKSVGFSH